MEKFTPGNANILLPRANTAIYLAEGPSGEWGSYVKGRLKEWELLGIIEPASKKKRRG